MKKTRLKNPAEHITLTERDAEWLESYMKKNEQEMIFKPYMSITDWLSLQIKEGIIERFDKVSNKEYLITFK